MTLRHMSKRHRVLRRALLTAAYLGSCVAGLSAILLPPRSLTTTDNPWVTALWASVAVVGGLAGAWAVATDSPTADRHRWRIERWASPLAAGGAFGYGLGVWAATFDTPTRMTQSAWVVVVVLLLLDRVIEVDSTATRYRTLRNLNLDRLPTSKEK